MEKMMKTPAADHGDDVIKRVNRLYCYWYFIPGVLFIANYSNIFHKFMKNTFKGNQIIHFGLIGIDNDMELFIIRFCVSKPWSSL
jgi:hypothetical protein